MSGTVGDNTARASGVIASAGGGTILSVKSMKFTTTASETGTVPTQLSNFDMSFAPTTSDGKLYFQAYLSVGGSSDNGTAFYFYDVTNTTIIGAYADAAGSRLRTSFTMLIDGSSYTNTVAFGCWHEPGTTSSIDYTIFGNAHASDTLYINRTQYNIDNTYIYNARPASVFTITEYAADAVTLT